ncbi:signal recognition particle-docking protein FtsY [Candidatus Poriferisodalis sp.]|uniref:signal recognition particle-docking protein FtsY n=1 Tax=Candidatus Poriferisodalis sp. TaxID=3101277 RepID=UPI003B5A561C
MRTTTIGSAVATIVFLTAIVLMFQGDAITASYGIVFLAFFAGIVLLALVPFVHRAVQRRWGRTSRPLRPSAVRPSARPADVPTAAPAPHDESVATVDAEPERPGVTFASGLASSRRSLRDRLASIRGRRPDGDTWEVLEEALLGADVGVATTMATLERLRSTAADLGIVDSGELVLALGDQMRACLDADRSLAVSAPGREGATPVWLFVGVNGVGKTTTIGKVGARFSEEGRSVVMAAGDTFRAAATSQLQTWADRCGAELVSGSSGADPSSVVHDAITAAAARDADVVLADTAGRLQNRKNLMDELAKVRRVADREPGAVAETLLVIDATTGQNGLSQARAFAEATDVTGVVLTKLDGSAKGGIVFAIEAELGLPVKLVGLGEGAHDLIDFDPGSYVDALLPASPQSASPQSASWEED